MEIYNTTWWGNAIDTAITAGTEPDFFGSQMKMLTSQQPEIVVNGDFSNGTNNWNVSNASQDVVNGELKIYNQTSSPAVSIQSISGLVIGKKYQITATTRLEGASGTVRASFFGNVFAQSTIIGQSVTQTTEVTATTTSATFALYLYGTSSTEGYFDNVSVKIARAEEVEAVKCLADWIHTTALQDLNN